MKPKVVDREHAECGGAMISKLTNAIWPKGSFVDTNKVWQQDWFYITEPRDAKWAAEPAFGSGPPERLTSWTKKDLDWGSHTNVTTLMSHVTGMISEGHLLSSVVQVMLTRLVLPCQSRDSSLWEFNPAGDKPLKHLSGSTRKDICKHLFKSQEECPEENEDAGFSTEISATEVIMISAKHLSFPIT